jgi:hypothetical protein
MTATLQQLLDQASHPDNPADIRRLARNHALDLVDVQTQHPDANDCGNQIPAGIPHRESSTYQFGPLPDEPDTRSAYYDQLERVLARLLDAQRSAMPYGEPMTEQGDIRLIRLVDLCTVYTRWCGGKDSAPPDRPDRIEKMHQCLARIQHQIAGRPDSELPPVAKNRPDFNLCWLVQGESQGVAWALPQTIFRQFPERTARDWVRYLALPGYTCEADYQRKVGLVAVEYTLSAQKLHKPTVVEAGHNSYFFPGYQREPHGTTAPPASDGQAPWSRADAASGLAEYVHTNQRIAAVRPQLRYLGDF